MRDLREPRGQTALGRLCRLGGGGRGRSEREPDEEKNSHFEIAPLSKQPEEADAQEQAGQDEGQGGRALCTSPRSDPSGLPRPDQHSWVGKNVQVNPTLEEDYQKQPYHTHARPLSCLYKKCIAQIHFDPPLLSRPSQQTVTLRHFLTETKLCMKNQHN